MNTSSSIHPAQPSPANLSRPDGSATGTAKPSLPRPHRKILFMQLFCHYYELLTDRNVALSALGRRNLAYDIWDTYSENQKVAWRDSAKDAAERHGEILPGYTYRATTLKEVEREKRLEERDARERKAKEIRRARERLIKAAEAVELKSRMKDASIAKRSAKRMARYTPYSKSSKPAQPSDDPMTGSKHTVPSTSAHATGHTHHRASRRVISAEDAELERMLKGLALSAGDMD